MTLYGLPVAKGLRDPNESAKKFIYITSLQCIDGSGVHLHDRTHPALKFPETSMTTISTRIMFPTFAFLVCFPGPSHECGNVMIRTLACL